MLNAVIIDDDGALLDERNGWMEKEGLGYRFEGLNT